MQQYISILVAGDRLMSLNPAVYMLAIAKHIARKQKKKH